MLVAKTPLAKHVRMFPIHIPMHFLLTFYTLVGTLKLNMLV